MLLLSHRDGNQVLKKQHVKTEFCMVSGALAQEELSFPPAVCMVHPPAISWDLESASRPEVPGNPAAMLAATGTLLP